MVQGGQGGWEPRREIHRADLTHVESLIGGRERREQRREEEEEKKRKRGEKSGKEKVKSWPPGI